MPLKSSTLTGIDTTLDMFQKEIARAVVVSTLASHIKGDLLAQKAMGLEISMDLVNKAAQDYAKVHGDLLVKEGASIIKGKKISWLSDNMKSTRQKVIDVIQKGLDEGKPVAQIGGKRVAPGTIAKDLEDLLIRDRGYQNVRIARTEVGRIQNIGSLNRYRENGLKFVHVLDDEGPNSCDECKEANGQTWTIEYAMNNELEHPNCFIDPQIPIYTSQGWTRITDVKKNDLVLTHKGRFKRVFDTIRIPKQSVKVISFEIGESQTNTKKLTVTDNHPILTKDGWKQAKNLTESDCVSVMANVCTSCNELVPWWRKACSLSCSGQKIMLSLRSDQQWIEKSMAAQKQKMREIYSNPENRKKQTEKANIKTRELVKKGKHTLQQYENHVKSNRTLAQNKYRTFLEKKMEWLLSEMGLNAEPQPIIERTELVKNNINGGKRKRYYKPDFLLPEHNIIIECDGEYWHDKDSKYEIKRQRYLENKGYTVLRFGEADIRNNLAFCADTINRVIDNHEGNYNFMWMPIKNIKSYEPQTRKTLYNLAVEEDNSYLAKGIVVHNCVRSFAPVVD